MKPSFEISVIYYPSRYVPKKKPLNKQQFPTIRVVKTDRGGKLGASLLILPFQKAEVSTNCNDCAQSAVLVNVKIIVKELVTVSQNCSLMYFGIVEHHPTQGLRSLTVFAPVRMRWLQVYQLLLALRCSALSFCNRNRGVFLLNPFSKRIGQVIINHSNVHIHVSAVPHMWIMNS